ncbi:MAG: macro domain-containing protein [Spirochaetales bacterium]
MAELTYVTGDATAPGGEGPKVIAHVCNDVGKWGRGFVVALSKRWDEPEAQFRAWYRSGEEFALGKVQFVQVEDELWVANMVGQRDVKAQGGVPPIRYEAVAEALGRVAEFARDRGASVHMPRIGAGLAGGDWDEIARIVRQECVDRGVEVTVYDLPT